MFYERLKALLAERGLSDQKFLAAIGMGRNQMTNWRNGNVPNLSTIERIARYLGVSVEYLNGEDENKDPSLERKQQEGVLLKMFRATTEEGRFRIIQAVMNICDEIEKKSASSNSSVTG